METALENLSKEDLLKVISSRDEALAERDLQISALVEGSSKKDERIDYLESQLACTGGWQFGQSRERFEGDPNQISLPLDAEPAAV